MAVEKIVARNKKYKVIEFLGSGSSSEVYLVYEPYFDPLADYHFALKVLFRRQMSPNYWSYFQSFKENSWKYSANCLGLESIGERVALKLQYIDGPSLQELKTYFSSRNQSILISIFYQIREGLWELHEKGFVHGDLSRSNVIISLKGHISLIDHEPRNEFQSLYAPHHMSNKNQDYDLKCFDNLVYHIIDDYDFLSKATKQSLLQFCNQSHEVWRNRSNQENYSDILMLIKDFKKEEVTERTLVTDLNQRKVYPLITATFLILLSYIFIPNMTNGL